MTTRKCEQKADKKQDVEQHQRKAKAYNTCIAPQAAYRSCTVHVTAEVQPIGRRLSLNPQTDL